MERLAVVAHGVSLLNKGLSDRGRRQANLIGRIFKDNYGMESNGVVLISSPAMRCKQTSEIIRMKVSGRDIFYMDELWDDYDVPRAGFIPCDLSKIFERVENLFEDYDDVVIVTHRNLTSSFPRYFSRVVFNQDMQFEELIFGDAYLYSELKFCLHCFQFAVSPTLNQTSAFKPRHTQKVGDFQKMVVWSGLGFPMGRLFIGLK